MSAVKVEPRSKAKGGGDDENVLVISEKLQRVVVGDTGFKLPVSCSTVNISAFSSLGMRSTPCDRL